jgi:acetyltransferase-like isoleucine patch superfamily enzyme
MKSKIIKKILSPFIKIKYRIIHSKGTLYIGNHVILRNRKRIFFGKGVNISPYCLLIAGGGLVLKDNVYIGYYSEIMVCHMVEIGVNTICGPFMFVTDSNHEYRNPYIPISEQGAPISEKNNSIRIGSDCWIGAHVTIAGNVTIGKHCVIGANSFVNSNIPDYCVAVGTPARIIKQYNKEAQKWKKLK